MTSSSAYEIVDVKKRRIVCSIKCTTYLLILFVQAQISLVAMFCPVAASRSPTGSSHWLIWPTKVAHCWTPKASSVEYMIKRCRCKFFVWVLWSSEGFTTLRPHALRAYEANVDGQGRIKTSVGLRLRPPSAPRLIHPCAVGGNAPDVAAVQ